MGAPQRKTLVSQDRSQPFPDGPHRRGPDLEGAQDLLLWLCQWQTQSRRGRVPSTLSAQLCCWLRADALRGTRSVHSLGGPARHRPLS